MADSLLVNLPADASLTGTEELYVNDGLVDKKATANQVKAFTLDTPLTIQGDNAAAVDQFVVRHGTVKAHFNFAPSGLFGGGVNARVVWTAVTAGAAGNSITISTTTDGDAISQPLSVAVAGSDITIHLQTDGAGEPISTANQVIAAVAASGPASALVTGANAAGNNGTGVYLVQAGQSLKSGLDAGDTFSLDTTGHVKIPALPDNSSTLTLEAPDNTPRGPGYDFGYALNIQPKTLNWNGAIYVNVGDQLNTTGSGFIIRAIDEVSGAQVLDFDSHGAGNIKCAPTYGGGFSVSNVDDTHAFNAISGADYAAARVLIDVITRIGNAANPNAGFILTRQNAALGDGALDAHELQLWFDSTDGAATPRWKGKSADGTVVSGSLGGGIGTVKRISQTPTVSTSPAYTAKDAVGGLLTFANAAAAAGAGCVIETVTVIDNSQQMPALDLVLFDRTFTNSSDNAIFDPTDGDLLNVIGTVQLANWADFNDNSVATRVGLGMAAQLNGTSLFGQLVTRSTPTFVATSDITVIVECLQD